MAQRFGEMLVSRRRQMGISLQQAANVIKMRPQIIEYFETENFAAMPPRGYAQGMIASYARYLGLNPRDVVDAYFDALHDYEHRGGRAGRYQDAAFDPNPRSAQLPGRYHVRDAERPSSRFAQRPPQAGYVSEETSPHEPLAASRLRPLPMAGGRRGGAGRPERANVGAPARSRTTRGYQPEGDLRGYAPAPERARGPRPTRDGAMRVRGDQRIPGDAPARSRRSSDGGRPPQGGGFDWSRLPFDPKYLIAALVALLAIIALSALLLMRGCAPKEEPKASAGSDAVQTVTKDTEDDASADEDKSDASADDSSEDDADADVQDDESADKKKPKPAVPEKTMVTVKVKGDDVVAWVEVNLDGKSVLGKQVLAPFEQEYEVTQQIDITTNSPSNVTVYKNGKKVRYDTKVSGVAKVSIAAPKIETVDLSVDINDDGIADMTAEDALNAGYDVESRTVDTVTIPKAEYAYATDDEDGDGASNDTTDASFE